MKKILIPILFAVLALPLATGCSDDITADRSLAEPPYELSPGAPGSVDEAIYDICQKYNTYVLYDFNDKNIIPTWRSYWSIEYTTADASEDGKYIRKILDVVTSNLFEKYSDEFVKTYFPYEIFICETLKTVSTSTTEVDAAANGEYSLAVSKAGAAQESMTAAKWDTYVFTAQRALADHYYSKLPSYPTAFLEYVADLTGLNIPSASGSAPAGMGWTANNHRCWSSGFIMSTTQTGNRRPASTADLSDYYIFLTNTGKTEMENRFQYYPRLKERTILLYGYLEEVFKVDLVAMQNKNVPGDKLPAGFFESL